MRPFTSVLLALGLPVLAAAEVEVRSFLSADGKVVEVRAPIIQAPPPTHHEPLFNTQVIPQKCVQLNGHMGCSKAGHRICIYTVAGRRQTKRMGSGKCTRRPRIGIPVRGPAPVLASRSPIPNVFARAAVPAPEVKSNNNNNNNKNNLTDTTTTTTSSKPNTKGPLARPPPNHHRKIAPMTASSCAARQGRRLCYRGQQVCIYRSKLTQKLQITTLRGRCRSRPRPPVTPKRPLFPPTTIYNSPPFRPPYTPYTHPLKQPLAQGAKTTPATTTTTTNKNTPPKPAMMLKMVRRSTAAPGIGARHTSLHRRTKMLWVTPPECQKLGGFMTCLGGRKTCRYTDPKTGMLTYQDLPGTCTRRILKDGDNSSLEKPLTDPVASRDLKEETSQIAARSPDPVLPESNDGECKNLGGTTRCGKRNKVICRYRGANGKIAIKELDTVCTYNPGDLTAKTGPEPVLPA